MGNTWTGENFADVYQSVIKIGDNTTLDNSLKGLSDGLGNDLPLKVSDTEINICGTDGLSLGTAGSVQGILKLHGATSGTMTIKAPAAAGSLTYILPATCTDTYVMSTDASGNLSWVLNRSTKRTIYKDLSNWSMAVDNSGNTVMEDSFVKQSNDRYWGRRIIFKDSGTKTGLGISFTMPEDIVSDVYLCILWMSTAVTGNSVVWDFDYNCTAKNDTTGDFSSDEENATVTTADSSTSLQRVVSKIPLTFANLTAGGQCIGNLCRDGGNGSDSLAADVIVENIYLEYKNY